MRNTEFVEASGNFSLYGVVRFAAYILAAVGMYMGNLQVAGIAFGFGATLGFVRRLARIWEQIVGKKKQNAFHIKNKLKQFELKDGSKFWAKDEEDAKLYRKHVGEKQCLN